jgi:transposase InsO family protein
MLSPLLLKPLDPLLPFPLSLSYDKRSINGCVSPKRTNDMQESQLIGERAALRCLLHQHPEWTNEDFALALGRSVGWVKKWKQRLRQARADDLQVLHSHSRARHTPPPPPHPHLVERILEIREKPPDNLQRVPGPKAILYFLQRDASLQALGIRVPRSTRTVWKILRKAGCILDPPQRKRRPLPPREPLEEIQVDFKDASTVAADPSGEGKHQHVVEVCHGVDAGTSTLLLAQPHQDYHAETALEAVVELFRRYGLPEILTFDRDPRWVGSSTGRDFPSAFCRFLLCLGVQPNICPPHRPDRNAYVERYHRSYNQECLQVHRPSTLQEVREVTEQYMYHYNHERPHQGRSCGNRPPREAFPTLPTLPALPQMVDPDRWLQAIHGQAFVRRVGRDGCLDVDHQTRLPSPEAWQANRWLSLSMPMSVSLNSFMSHWVTSSCPSKGSWQGPCLLSSISLSSQSKLAPKRDTLR